ncbi:MAG: PAS domain S-box protein [Betaproteobacteria bacterium]|nr:MAG: PAS domain S-box protein [Betaproteobacteria bacterium]
MTRTSRRLWIGFGVSTGLLIVFSVVVLSLLRSIEHDIAEQSDVARPRSLAAKQLEVGLLGYALAVRTFYQTGDPRFKQTAAEEAAQVRQHLAEYERLASSTEQRELAARFASQWREYEEFAQSLLKADRLSIRDSERLARLRIALERFVDEEMQGEADRSYDARRERTVGHLRGILGGLVVLLGGGLLLAFATSIVVSRGIVRGERALSREHGQLEAIIQAMADGVMVFDMSGNAIVVNDAQARLIGYENADQMKRNREYFADRFELADLDGNPVPVDQWPVSRVLRGESLREWQLAVRRKDVPRHWVISFSAEPVRNGEGDQILALVVSRDVTRRKENEEQLRDSEERHRLASNIAGVAHWDWDLTSGTIHWSGEFRQLYGMDPAAGPSYESWRAAIVPDDFPKLDRAIQQAIAECGTYRVEFRIRHPERGVRSLLGAGRAIPGETGAAARLIAVSMDITELKQAEEEVRRLAESLERRVDQRTAELAEANFDMQAFSYTVSHDLRAPLRGIQGFAHALVEDFSASLGDEGREYCQRISAAGERMEDLIEDLLDYSRLAQQEIVTKPIELQVALDEALQQLQEQIGRTQAQISVTQPLGTVLAPPAVLIHVLQNLLANAVTFVAKGQCPRVRVWSQKMDGHLRLNVEDEGIGIEQRNLQRIFNVFERLHGDEAYPGTGIGLAIVKRAMERLGGTCGVESTPGKGSRFWIELRKV